MIPDKIHSMGSTLYRGSLVDGILSAAVWEKRADIPAVCRGRDKPYYPMDVVDA